MRRLIIIAVAVLSLAAVAGCSFIGSAQGGNTSMTNEAWFAEHIGLGPMLIFSSHVYYCPPMGSGGASTCMEAEMIENAPAAAAGAPAAPAPPPTAPPPPPPAGGPEGGEGGE
jgi:hypothetical protein